MTHFDVFNGDADGICALVQLRLAAPIDAVLVTGTKRNIALLDRVAGDAGDTATVLDISLAANRAALLRLLDRGVAVQYSTTTTRASSRCTRTTRTSTPIVGLHRHPGRPPSLRPASRLGDRGRLRGQPSTRPAETLASSLGLPAREVAALRDLGDCLTYNAYGVGIEDAIVHPGELFRTLLRHADPFRYMSTDGVFAAIDEARRRDLALAWQIRPAHALPRARVYVLPDAAWSHRVRGLFSNELANAEPGLAHAVLTANADGGFAVSVRAPHASDGPMGCAALPRGGARSRGGSTIFGGTAARSSSGRWAQLSADARGGTTGARAVPPPSTPEHPMRAWRADGAR